MAVIHIDYATGDDTTGNGTSGTPYKTLTKAFAVLTTSDSIKIANTSAQQETNLAFPALTFTVDIPLIIEGWNNGGSIVIDSPDGDITAVGQIDNGGTTNPLFTNTIAFVKFVRIKFTDFSTNFWTGGTKTSNSFIYCEINNCNDAGTFATATMYGCVWVGNSGDNFMTLGALTSVLFCYFSGYRISLSGATSTNIQNCIFRNVTSTSVAIAGTSDGARIVNNTFVGKNFGDATANRGISYAATSNEDLVITGNHFQNYSGSGGVAFDAQVSVPVTRGTFLLVGGNSFWNCNTKYDVDIAQGTVVDVTSTDVTEVADPLVDISNLEFEKKTTALSYQVFGSFMGFPGTNTLSNMTTGAVNDAPASGGGLPGGSWGFT